MQYLYGAIIGIIIYMFIGLMIGFIFGKPDWNIYWSAGIFTLLIGLILIIFSTMEKLVHYKLHRTIIENRNTNKKFYCHCKYHDDFKYYSLKYRVVEQYAKKSEWSKLPQATSKTIEETLKNCSRCKYEKECDGTTDIKCKHNCWNDIEKYNKFEKR